MVDLNKAHVKDNGGSVIYLNGEIIAELDTVLKAKKSTDYVTIRHLVLS